MVRIAFVVFTFMTAGTSALTYMNIGLEEQKFDDKASIRQGSHGGVGVGGGYRVGK